MAVGGAKNGTCLGGGNETEEAPVTIVASAIPASHSPASGGSNSTVVSTSDGTQYVLALPSTAENQKSLLAPPKPPHQLNDNDADRSNLMHGDDQDKS